MKTFRHNYSLVLGNDKRPIIAPRYFCLNGNMYFVHISKDVEHVFVFIRIRSDVENEIQVVLSYELKIYINSKGLYFNFGYWADDLTHKIKKIYLGE